MTAKPFPDWPAGSSPNPFFTCTCSKPATQQQVRLRPSAIEVQEAATHHVGAIRLEGREGRTEIAPRPKPVNLRLNREAMGQAVAEAASSVEAGAERTLVVIGLADADGAEHFAPQEILAECGRRAGQAEYGKGKFSCKKTPHELLGIGYSKRFRAASIFSPALISPARAPRARIDAGAVDYR